MRSSLTAAAYRAIISASIRSFFANRPCASAKRRTRNGLTRLTPTAASVRAEITANVWQVRTEVGADVGEGDELVILESMKMEIPVTAPSAGRVLEVRVVPDDQVQEGDVVAVLDP